MYSYSKVDERKLYFHRIFQEVITATENRMETCSFDVKFFYGFHIRYCIYLQVPDLAELVVNNRRCRVTCRNSCFSTAFSVVTFSRSETVVGRDVSSAPHSA